MSAPSMTDSQWDRWFVLIEQLQKLSADERAAALQALRVQGEEDRLVLAGVALHFRLPPELDRCRTGERIGDCTLGDQLGLGGMGVVYRAMEDVMDEPTRAVAVKLIHPAFVLTGDDDTGERFAQEMRLLAQLEHPNIARFYRGGVYRNATGETIPFIVMQLVRNGRSLTDYAEQEDLPVPARLELFLTVCEAVKTLHQHQPPLIHRDLKPTNILVNDEGCPFVLDFGLAQVCDPARRRGGREGVAGTPAYMSPEQVATPWGPGDPRSDLYTLGIILFELLTGQRPYTVPPDASWAALRQAILQEVPAPLSHHKIECRGDLDTIVARTLAKAPAERYPSVAALQRDIREYLEIERAIQVQDRAAKRRRSTPETAHLGPQQSTGLQSTPHNLSLPLKPLIGGHRIQQVIDWAQQIRERQRRILPFWGGGGTGKTTVALHIAQKCIDYFRDGVWFIDLTGATSGHEMRWRIAHQILPLNQPRNPDKIESFLSDKQMLLLLDCTDQIKEEAGDVIVALKNAAPLLQGIVTSRYDLGLPDDPIEPIPDMHIEDAIELFEKRACARRPTFQVNANNRADIISICQRVGCSPLFIEIAAYRIHQYHLAEICARLNDHFSFLEAKRPGVAKRHHSERAVIEETYRALSALQQHLFIRLVVFQGGVTEKAALEICVAMDTADKPSAEDLEILLRYGLIHIDPNDRFPQTRYYMLDTLHQYIERYLINADELRVTQQRHTKWFIELAKQAEPNLAGAEQSTACDLLEADLLNLRAAMEKCRQNAEFELWLEAASAIWPFWRMRGYLHEGRKSLEEVLSQATAHVSTPVLARARAGAGWLAWAQGDYASAMIHHNATLALYQDLNDEQGMASSLLALAHMVGEEGDIRRMRELTERALSILSSQGEKNNKAIAHGLNLLGEAGRAEGRRFMWVGDTKCAEHSFNEAIRWNTASLALYEQLGEKRFVAGLHFDLGCIALCQHNLREAKNRYKAGMKICEEIGDTLASIWGLEGIAGVCVTDKDPRSAAVLLGAAEAERRRLTAQVENFEQPFVEQWLRETCKSMNEREFNTAWEMGSQMSLEQAREYGLQRW